MGIALKHKNTRMKSIEYKRFVRGKKRRREKTMDELVAEAKKKDAAKVEYDREIEKRRRG